MKRKEEIRKWKYHF